MTSIRRQVDPAVHETRMLRTFEAEDAWGDSHDYEVRLYPPDEGFDLMPIVAEILAEPLAEFLGNTDLGKLDPDAEVDVALLFGDGGGLDPVAMKTAILAVGKGFQAHGGAQLLRRVLKHVRRDGVKLTFNVAYQGNYLEMFTAVYHVLRLNFGHLFTRDPM